MRQLHLTNAHNHKLLKKINASEIQSCTAQTSSTIHIQNTFFLKTNSTINIQITTFVTN